MSGKCYCTPVGSSAPLNTCRRVRMRDSQESRHEQSRCGPKRSKGTPQTHSGAQIDDRTTHKTAKQKSTVQRCPYCDEPIAVATSNGPDCAKVWPCGHRVSPEMVTKLPNHVTTTVKFAGTSYTTSIPVVVKKRENQTGLIQHSSRTLNHPNFGISRKHGESSQEIDSYVSIFEDETASRTSQYRVRCMIPN